MTNSTVPFQKIEDACRVTGLSRYYLRRGCRSGEIPCIKSGRTYLIDVAALLDKLHKEALGGDTNGPQS